MSFPESRIVKSGRITTVFEEQNASNVSRLIEKEVAMASVVITSQRLSSVGVRPG